jgi:hypothetical protein
VPKVCREWSILLQYQASARLSTDVDTKCMVSQYGGALHITSLRSPAVKMELEDVLFAGSMSGLSTEPTARARANSCRRCGTEPVKIWEDAARHGASDAADNGWGSASLPCALSRANEIFTNGRRPTGMRLTCGSE